MKTKFIENKMHYSGKQLSPLYAYLEHQIMGNSIVSWMGSCNVGFEDMVDGEDFLEKSTIAGDEMLHFIVEAFDRDLFSAVSLQRILAGQIKDYLQSLLKNSEDSKFIHRKGDDLFWKDGKMSISIASRSAISVQIHFAINLTNAGTPVKTASLQDLGICDIRKFATDVMQNFAEEYLDVLQATQKVRPLY